MLNVSVLIGNCIFQGRVSEREQTSCISPGTTVVKKRDDEKVIILSALDVHSSIVSLLFLAKSTDIYILTR
jgi:hypothetical protein